jgi:hypothetical protein
MKRLGICQNEIGTRLGIEALGRMKGTLPRIQLGSRRILQYFNDLSDISALFGLLRSLQNFSLSERRLSF